MIPLYGPNAHFLFFLMHRILSGMIHTNLETMAILGVKLELATN